MGESHHPPPLYSCLDSILVKTALALVIIENFFFRTFGSPTSSNVPSQPRCWCTEWVLSKLVALLLCFTLPLVCVLA